MDSKLFISLFVVLAATIWLQVYGNLSQKQERYVHWFAILSIGFITSFYILDDTHTKEPSTSIPFANGASQVNINDKKPIYTSLETPEPWKVFKATYGVATSQNVQSDNQVEELVESMKKGGWKDPKVPIVDNVVSGKRSYWLWRTDRTTENGKYGYWRYAE